MENNSQKTQKQRALEFISKIELPLNVSRTNYISNSLNENIITFDDIPDDILENYKLNIGNNITSINVNFLKAEAGWIDFTIKANDKLFESRFSCVFDPLLDLKRWLEDICKGAYNASFSYDTEGKEYLLSFDTFYFDKYLLSITDNNEDDNKTYIRVQVNKYQLVEAFYNSYIEFTLSDKYPNGEWEKHNGVGYEGLPAKEFKSEIVEDFLNKKH